MRWAGGELDPVRRRRFIGGAIAAGAGLAVGRGSTIGAAPDPRRKLRDTLTNTTNALHSVLHSPAADAPFDTVVILMMENRSFDHYLGWLGADQAYLEQGRSRYGAAFSVDGRTAAGYPRPDGTIASTFHLPSQTSETNPWRGCGHPDPGHGWDSGRTQRDHGFVAEGSGNDDYALGYFLEPDLPCYAPLARHFTVFDRAFCSLMTGTYPNRYYLHAAQSDGMKDGTLPIAEAGFDWPTITDHLLASGVSVGAYFTDVPVIAFWGPRMVPLVRPIADFFVDAAAGRLPRVVFLDPGFMSGMRTDDHPHGDMRTAQAFVNTLVRAFQASPQWRKGVFFVTYDEWGGFWDHVAPVHLADDRSSPDDNEDFSLSGFRIPVIMASPYAQAGYVDHGTYDHASILRFLEWRFLGAPPEGSGGGAWSLTTRDRHAANIGASLSPTRINDFLLDPLAAPIVTSLPCDGQYFQDVPVLVDVEDLLHEHPLADPALLDRFQSFGYKLGPSATLAELTGG